MTHGRDSQARWALLALDGALHALTGGLAVIGRGDGSDVVVPYPSVSRRHAIVRLEGERPELEDAGSRHGTTLNDRAVMGPAELMHGDRIGIAGVTLVVQDLARLERTRPATTQMRRVRVAAPSADSEETTREHALAEIRREPSE